MLDRMDGLHRTKYCGEFNKSDVGEVAVVCGFCQRQRDLGQLIFIDLRDRTGIVQLAFDDNTDKAVFSSNTDWIQMSESNKVFDGEYTFVPGWCEIEFNKDFSYEGENILLCVIDNTNVSTSTISFKQNYTPSSYQTLYHFTDSKTYGPFNASSLSSSGTRKYQNTHIKLFFKMLLDGVTPTPEEITFESSIRGGNYWTEKDLYSATEKITLKVKNATISNISLSDNSFFTIPANIDLTADPVEFNI